MKDREFADAFESSLKEIGCSCGRYGRRSGFYVIKGFSKDLADWIDEMSVDGIFEIANKYPAEFLRGYFDSEGDLRYVPCDNHWKTEVCSTDYEIISKIKELVENLGFETSLYKRDLRGRETTFRDLRIVAKKPIWYVYILGGSENTKKFIETIQPSIKRKRAALDKN